MKFHLTKSSSNRKTGKIPVSTSSKETCPSSCPFREKGCYGNGGPLNLHWKHVTDGNRGDEWPDFLEKIAKLPKEQIWRHNQVGDLLGTNDKLSLLRATELCEANKGRKGYTYTHFPVEGKGHKSRLNKEVIAFMNKEGFVVNLSANDQAHADELVKLDIAPVTTTLSSDWDLEKKTFKTPAGNKGIVCPAITKDNTTCATCKICALPKEKRKYIVGFPAHGSQKKAVSKWRGRIS